MRAEHRASCVLPHPTSTILFTYKKMRLCVFKNRYVNLSITFSLSLKPHKNSSAEKEREPELTPLDPDGKHLFPKDVQAWQARQLLFEQALGVLLGSSSQNLKVTKNSPEEGGWGCLQLGLEHSGHSFSGHWTPTVLHVPLGCDRHHTPLPTSAPAQVGWTVDAHLAAAPTPPHPLPSLTDTQSRCSGSGTGVILHVLRPRSVGSTYSSIVCVLAFLSVQAPSSKITKNH